MGYTHYWYYPEKDTKAVKAGFGRAKAVVLDIFKRNGKTPNVKRLQDNILWLDGTCETFVVVLSAERARAGRENYPDPGFAFCKTARDPYDLVVCEALLALAYHVPGFTINSDGFCLDFAYDEANGIMGGLDENWPQAFANVKDHYGIEFEYAIERSPCSNYGTTAKPVIYRKVIPSPLRKPAASASDQLASPPTP